MHRMKSIREKLIAGGLDQQQVRDRLRVEPLTDKDGNRLVVSPAVTNFVAESLQKYVDVSFS